jgi:hypothetical protein
MDSASSRVSVHRAAIMNRRRHFSPKADLEYFKFCGTPAGMPHSVLNLAKAVGFGCLSEESVLSLFFGRKSNESLQKPQHPRKVQLRNASLRGLVPRVSGLFPGCDVRREFWVPDMVVISCFMSGSSVPRVTDDRVIASRTTI